MRASSLFNGRLRLHDPGQTLLALIPRRPGHDDGGAGAFALGQVARGGHGDGEALGAAAHDGAIEVGFPQAILQTPAARTAALPQYNLERDQCRRP